MRSTIYEMNSFNENIFLLFMADSRVIEYRYESNY